MSTLSDSICSVEGCERKVYACGLCQSHNRRRRLYGDPLGAPAKREPRTCNVSGCRGKHLARGYCSKHYGRLTTYGSVMKRTSVPRSCSVPGCDLKHKSLGYCRLHYDRFKRTGTTVLTVKAPRGCQVFGCERPHKGHGYCATHLINSRDMGTCSMEGCAKPHKARGYCDTHYCYLLRTGALEKLPKRTLASRFWSKVTKLDPVSCWQWQGAGDEHGYGRLGHAGRTLLATHVAWYLESGDWPTELGMNVCHSCDNPSCVNPRHLWLGTQKDNGRDMSVKGRAPHVPNIGESNGSARLTEPAVREIRRLAEGGATYTELARRYGVTRTAISSAVRRITWRHVV